MSFSRCSRGITIRLPLMTRGDDSSSTIASSSRILQKSWNCFGQRRRSLGQPDWIVRIRICMDRSCFIAALTFSIRASATAVWRISKTPTSSLRSLVVKVSCTRALSSRSYLGSFGSIFRKIRDRVSANGICFLGTKTTFTLYI